MPHLLVSFYAIALASMIKLFLGLASPRVLATIIVLATHKYVKKTKSTWDDQLLESIKKEWEID